MTGSLDIGFVASGDPAIDTFDTVASGGTGPIARLGTQFAADGHDVTVYAGTHGSRNRRSDFPFDVVSLPTPDVTDVAADVVSMAPVLERLVDDEKLSATPARVIERLFGRLAFSKRAADAVAAADHDLLYLRDRVSGFFSARGTTPSVFTVVSPDACRFYFRESVRRHPLNAGLFWYKRALERSVVANADETIVMNDQVRREYESVADGAISTVTLGVSESSFATDLDGDREPVILYVGRIDSNKRPELLVDAFAAVAQEPYELHVLGDGPRRDVVRRRAAAGVADRVRLHGTVPRETVLERMREAAVFVLPSKYENCPNVIVEAMASGCPVVASDTTGCRVLVTDGETGRLFDREDPAALETVLSEVLADEDHRRSLATAAHEYALAEHTVEDIAAAYLAVGQRARRRES